MRITLALVDGKIHTMEGVDCEAVAVCQDKIIKVGTTAEIMELTDDQTTMIYLDGKSVFPGFIDTHTHLVGYGTSLNSVDLSMAKSTEDIIDSCRDFIQSKGIEPEIGRASCRVRVYI